MDDLFVQYKPCRIRYCKISVFPLRLCHIVPKLVCAGAKDSENHAGDGVTDALQVLSTNRRST